MSLGILDPARHLATVIADADDQALEACKACGCFDCRTRARIMDTGTSSSRSHACRAASILREMIETAPPNARCELKAAGFRVGIFR